jgi:hypothetical protein
MVNPHSESFAPMMLGLAVMVVTPALAPLIPDPVIATLMATPLRQAGTAILVSVFLAALSVWTVSRVSPRRLPAAEGGDD